MERPILFSAPMVRAILDGRKSQTRRVAKLNISGRLGRFSSQWHPEHPGAIAACPYGQPGDRLWVRETWAGANSEDGPCVLYRANDDRRYLVQESYPVNYAKYPGVDFAQWAADVESGAEGRWRPSIHMPRWASRITLEITDVRVQRVQDIGEEDAIAEGIRELPLQEGEPGAWWSADPLENAAVYHRTPRSAFSVLWDAINGLRGFGWNANPWVWAIAFRRVEG